MATATILKLENTSSATATITLYREGGMAYQHELSPGALITLDPTQAVPEAKTGRALGENHGTVTIYGVTGTYTFWQNGLDIYYSLEGKWNQETKMDFSGQTPDTHEILLKISEDGGPWVAGDLIEM